MTINIPDNLVWSDSRIRLYYDDVIRVNRTSAAVIFEGTRNGFLALANSLIFLANDLEQKIAVHQLPFIEADVEFVIKVDMNVWSACGVVARVKEGLYTWRLTEDNLVLAASTMHSLGHLNPEAHLDEDCEEEDISVYCVVE